MTTPFPASDPVLQAPGAGLPWIELQAARLLFHSSRLTGSYASRTAMFEKERANIASLVAHRPSSERSTRVLIRRLRGMEDSSRHWSVLMTLEHLRLVNTGIAQVIPLLAAGKEPPGQASTAAVKPSPGAGEEAIEGFNASCEKAAAAAEQGARSPTASRFAHPWFGSLDARGWHHMLGFHMKLHRRQIEAILAGLRERMP